MSAPAASQGIITENSNTIRGTFQGADQAAMIIYSAERVTIYLLQALATTSLKVILGMTDFCFQSSMADQTQLQTSHPDKT